MRKTKFFSIAFLLVILLHCGVLLFLWQMEIYRLHTQNWNNEKSEGSFQISLTQSEYEKGSVNDHEIRISNKMFDIKQIQITEKGVILDLNADESEDLILDAIAAYSNGANATSDKSSIPLSILFSLNYFQSLQEFTFHDPSSWFNLFFENNLNWKDTIAGIQSPPPKPTAVI